jgi:hypothetical protein
MTIRKYRNLERRAFNIVRGTGMADIVVPDRPIVYLEETVGDAYPNLLERMVEVEEPVVEEKILVEVEPAVEEEPVAEVEIEEPVVEEESASVDTEEILAQASKIRSKAKLAEYAMSEFGIDLDAGKKKTEMMDDLKAELK